MLDWDFWVKNTCLHSMFIEILSKISRYMSVYVGEIDFKKTNDHISPSDHLFMGRGNS